MTKVLITSVINSYLHGFADGVLWQLQISTLLAFTGSAWVDSVQD